MSEKRGIIILMGSGELTTTMVEVHKEVLGRLSGERKAVFLDTPAGFQLNADQLSQRALEYFRSRVGHPMSVVSFKSAQIDAFEAERAFRDLRTADFTLVGPGSPTYAVRQWKASPVPDIFRKRIAEGACLVAASAAALTVGRFTLPVYEIYKVGEEISWAEGINIFEPFGLSLVIIPHWNNAEGGTHDTRFCFMGEERFNALKALLPEDVVIIGLDEHTACIMDMENDEAAVRGIGEVTILSGISRRAFRRGERFPLGMLRGEEARTVQGRKDQEPSAAETRREDGQQAFWQTVHAIGERFHEGLGKDPRDAASAILDLDRVIWSAHQGLENPEDITQSREMLREMIALLGQRLASAPDLAGECLEPLVGPLLALRESFRRNQQWKEADAIRNCLGKANIIVEDGPEGPQWKRGPW